jgi:hypothetical protein
MIRERILNVDKERKLASRTAYRMHFPRVPSALLRGVTSAGRRASYTFSSTFVHSGWGIADGCVPGRSALASPIGREDRTGRVPPWRSGEALGEGISYVGLDRPELFQSRKPWTEDACEKSDAWCGSLKRVWLRKVSVRKYGSGT